MIFYEISSRQDFAGYLPKETNGSISERLITPDSCREKESLLVEYCGEPPRKPAKKGDFHRSAYGYFVKSTALDFFEKASRGKLIKNPTKIIDRADEEFYQIWVTNYVDCLDVKNTVASPAGGYYKNKIGVIKRPVFDEKKWDGSDLFVVPQDPSFCLFCTEKFVEQWKQSKLKGMMFSRFLMDSEAIKC